MSSDGAARKKWSIQPVRIKEMPQPTSEPRTKAEKDHSEYLQQLQERQRQLRNTQKLDQKQQELEDRERGFQLNWSGANKQRVERHAKRTAIRSARSQGIVTTDHASSPFSYPPQDSIIGEGDDVVKRKGWKKDPNIFLRSHSAFVSRQGQRETTSDTETNTTEDQQEEEPELVDVDNEEEGGRTQNIDESANDDADFQEQKEANNKSESESDNENRYDDVFEADESVLVDEQDNELATEMDTDVTNNNDNSTHSDMKSGSNNSTLRLSRNDIAALRASLQGFSFSKALSTAAIDSQPEISTDDSEATGMNASETVVESSVLASETSTKEIQVPKQDSREERSNLKHEEPSPIVALLTEKLLALDQQKQEFLLKLLDKLGNTESVDVNMNALNSSFSVNKGTETKTDVKAAVERQEDPIEPAPIIEQPLDTFFTPTLTYSKPVALPSSRRKRPESGISEFGSNAYKSTVASSSSTSVEVNRQETVASAPRKVNETKPISKPNILLSALRKARPDSVPIWLMGPESSTTTSTSNEDQTDTDTLDAVADESEQTQTSADSSSSMFVACEETADSGSGSGRSTPLSGRRSARLRSHSNENLENNNSQSGYQPSVIASPRKLSNAAEPSGGRRSRPSSREVASQPHQITDQTTAVKKPASQNGLRRRNTGLEQLLDTPKLQATNSTTSITPKIGRTISDSRLQKRTATVTESLAPMDTLVDDDLDTLSSFTKELTKRSSSSRAAKKPLPKQQNTEPKRLTSSRSAQDIEATSLTQDEIKLMEDLSSAPKCNLENDTFQIPTLPSGKFMVINILSTWGDPHYVGLSGIEFFNENGQPVSLTDISKQVRADPADINVLPENKDDPRTVDKLFDNVNKTCDDTHMWLAPFTASKNHFIYITFDSVTTFSMIRLWNYNKSRIHSFRGARYIEITLDGNYIFKGEIQQAPGSLVGLENFAECVLFTTDENIIMTIEDFDERASNSVSDNDIQPRENIERPRTAGGSMSFNAGSLSALLKPPIDLKSEELFSKMDPNMRPMTSVSRVPQQTTGSHSESRPASECIVGQKIRIDFLTSWGDMYYVGLTGIEVLDERMQSIPIDTSQLTAVPRDMNSIPGHSGDDRVLENVVDGVNITTDDRHMWMLPLTLTNNPHLIIDMKAPVQIAAIKFYNYNKSLEDSFRGVKNIRITVDDRTIMDSFAVRKAPGNCNFDFGHVVSLVGDNGEEPYGFSVMDGKIMAAIQKVRSARCETPRQDYEIALLPTGYVFKFALLSTFGDIHYMGLSGIELYDANNKLIPLTINNIQAVPRSIEELPESHGDVRTLDKLIDGVNNTWNDEHMWLAPYAPGQTNFLYIIFEFPVAVSMIKIWNYSKTPSRGVEEIEICADDVLIYQGFLRQAPAPPRNIVASEAKPPNFVQTILFTNDPAVVKREKQNIFTHVGKDQNVVFFNQNKLEYGRMQPAPQQYLVRPMTSVVGTGDSVR